MAIAIQIESILFGQDIKRLTKGFIGRNWIFDKINHWLQQDNERFFLLVGEPGVGKSAIAARLTQNREEDIVAHHFCLADNPNTLKPEQILLSLSAQLMKTLPGYGQALLNTVKSPTLSVQVEITFKDATNSEIRDVFIANLKSNNESKEGQEDLEGLLEVLIQAPLAALGDYQDALPERAIFLIDGLDVAVSRAAAAQDDEDIVTLLADLSEAENLPSWVRFILTSRPDRRVWREFKSLHCLYKDKLDDLSDENQADIQQYIQKRVKQSIFPTLLAEAQMPEQALVKALIDQAQGNFRYVCCVLDDLEAGTLSLSSFPGLPESLKQIYAQEWFATEASAQQYKPILEAIANANSFLTEDELVSKTELRPRIVRQALWGLRQFLDTKLVSINPENSEEEKEKVEAFAIFHPSLKEYLLTRNLE